MKGRGNREGNKIEKIGTVSKIKNKEGKKKFKKRECKKNSKNREGV